MEWLVPILDSVLGSLARSALVAISAFLLDRHLVSQQIADQFVSDGVKHILIPAPAVLAIAWSIWSHVRRRVKLLTALESAPGTTEQQLEAKIENGLGVSVKAGAVLLACALGASVSACGQKSYHTAVVANTSIAQAIFTLQDEEIAAHTANLIDDAHHAQYKAVIVKLLQAGDDLTVALREWDPAQPAPANIGLAITQVSNLLNDLNVMTPTASKVIGAAQMVLSVLRGTGVLPSAEWTSAIQPHDGVAVSHALHSKFAVAGQVSVVEQEHVTLLLLLDLLAHRGHDRVIGQRVVERSLHASILLPAVTRG